MHTFKPSPKKNNVKDSVHKIVTSTRWYRKAHRWIAIISVFFLFLVGITGLLITWKDQLHFQPPSVKATSKVGALLPLQTIQDNAVAHIESLGLSTDINRIDYRPNKGMAKVRFEKHFTELQIDCYTGLIISEKTRTSDFIEGIHDGSIIDFYFSESTKPSKLIYSTFTALSLIFLSLSGFWLWINPKRIKKLKSKEK